MIMISDREELFNAFSHYLGSVLAIVAFVMLMGRYSHLDHGVLSVLVYSLSLFLLYSFSGTYHILPEGRGKRVARVFDHIGIYLLIAGSYTPYLLLVIPAPECWILLVAEWGLVVFGVFFKIFFTGRFKLLSTLVYLLMGWAVVTVFPQVRAALSPESFHYLIASGVAYSAGVPAYLFDSRRYMHFVWHLFVLAGSFFGFLSIYTMMTVRF